MQSNSLSQLITTTTRNTDKSNSLLDLILTNSKYISLSSALDHFLSDHQPIFVVKKKMRDNRPSVDFKGRSYRSYDRRKFRDGLLVQNWEEFYKIQDPNSAWDYILSQIQHILDDMCPIKTFKIKNYRPEWITPELIEQIKDRDYFDMKAKKEGCEDSWNIAKHLRNVTNANVRQAKREFVLFELESCETDYKKFWNTIRSVIPSNKGDARQEIMLKSDGKKLCKDKVAHFINDYFIGIGKVNRNGLSQAVVNGHVTNDTNPSHGMRVDDDMCESWSADEFMVDEVLNVVKNINVSKSSGLQNISSFLIKEAFTILIPQVTHMFNLTLATSIFPMAWKEALVIPIPKTGNLTLAKNYRPISLLPIPGKLLEKLMHKQLSNFIEENSLISDFQHGFRKQHSTIHSVAQLTNFVNIKMNAKLPTLATFVDFRKAFDCVQHCVQHDVLLSKLSHLGIG